MVGLYGCLWLSRLLGYHGLRKVLGCIASDRGENVMLRIVEMSLLAVLSLGAEQQEEDEQKFSVLPSDRLLISFNRHQIPLPLEDF